MVLTALILTGLGYTEEPSEVVPTYVEVLGPSVSFSTAKRRMYAIYKNNRETLYCNCEYKDKVVDLESCGLGEFDTMRWNRTEAEHVVPASIIGLGRECWSNGGRKNCLSVDQVFKTAHNDLHNLYPAVGQVNGIRSNISISMLPGDTLEYPGCDFEISRSEGIVEPRPEVRGNIARTYFYMEWRYGVSLSEEQRRIYLYWHEIDPVDGWERERDAAIADKQGNLNPFIH